MPPQHNTPDVTTPVVASVQQGLNHHTTAKQQPDHTPRSPRSTTFIATILLAAETAVCTTAPNGDASALAVQGGVIQQAEVPNTMNGTSATTNINSLPEEIRRKVCTYLSWRECLKLKALNNAWREATEEVVVQEMLPETATPAFFIRCPEGLLEDADVEAKLRCQHPAKWRCSTCGFCNSETRILCGNRSCQIPCVSHRDCARLFLGQLRREGTVPFLKWLVEGVFGSPDHPVTIANVENHRQLMTSRGKGCAWVYLTNRAMADTVMQYNHRVFLDVHAWTGREGVWLVEKDAQVALQEAAKVRGYVRGRDLVLPRNTLVVEYPARQPNQPWADAPTVGQVIVNPGYTANTRSNHGSSTPEQQWYPGTDTPSSVELNDTMTPVTADDIPSPHSVMDGESAAAATARRRRHQPYGTWNSAADPNAPANYSADPTLPPYGAEFNYNPYYYYQPPQWYPAPVGYAPAAYAPPYVPAYVPAYAAY